MLGFALSTRSEASVEEVWKLLHDPSRFPLWWVGVETVEAEAGGAYTMWPVGYPDYPMAQRLHAESDGRRVTISCLVSEVEFCWQLGEDGSGTSIDVEVHMPDREAQRLDAQRSIVAASLDRLARLAGT